MSNMSVSPTLMVVVTVMTASKAMVTERHITMTHLTHCWFLSRSIRESKSVSLIFKAINPSTPYLSGFSQIDKIDNNGNIGIRGFTM